MKYMNYLNVADATKEVIEKRNKRIQLEAEEALAKEKEARVVAEANAPDADAGSAGSQDDLEAEAGAVSRISPLAKTSSFSASGAGSLSVTARSLLEASAPVDPEVAKRAIVLEMIKAMIDVYRKPGLLQTRNFKPVLDGHLAVHEADLNLETLVSFLAETGRKEIVLVAAAAPAAPAPAPAPAVMAAASAASAEILSSVVVRSPSSDLAPATAESAAVAVSAAPAAAKSIRRSLNGDFSHLLAAIYKVLCEAGYESDAEPLSHIKVSFKGKEVHALGEILGAPSRRLALHNKFWRLANQVGKPKQKRAVAEAAAAKPESSEVSADASVESKAASSAGMSVLSSAAATAVVPARATESPVEEAPLVGNDLLAAQMVAILNDYAEGGFRVGKASTRTHYNTAKQLVALLDPKDAAEAAEAVSLDSAALGESAPPTVSARAPIVEVEKGPKWGSAIDLLSTIVNNPKFKITGHFGKALSAIYLMAKKNSENIGNELVKILTPAMNRIAEKDAAKSRRSTDGAETDATTVSEAEEAAAAPAGLPRDAEHSTGSTAVVVLGSPAPLLASTARRRNRVAAQETAAAGGDASALPASAAAFHETAGVSSSVVAGSVPSARPAGAFSWLGRPRPASSPASDSASDSAAAAPAAPKQGGVGFGAGLLRTFGIGASVKGTVEAAPVVPAAQLSASAPQISSYVASSSVVAGGGLPLPQAVATSATEAAPEASAAAHPVAAPAATTPPARSSRAAGSPAAFTLPHVAPAADEAAAHEAAAHSAAPQQQSPAL